MITRRAIKASVYRNAEITADCTGDGVSGQYNAVYVICEHGTHEVHQAGHPDGRTLVDGRPCDNVVVLMEHAGLVVARPIKQQANTMFGGNLLFTSDSRLAEEALRVFKQSERGRDLMEGADRWTERTVQGLLRLIPIHDRVE